MAATALAPRQTILNASMLLFTDRGPRSIDDRDVIAVYCGDTLGGPSILLRQLCSLRSAASAVR